MEKTVVFIINSIRQARCIRRVEEFIARGYKVEVYGFDREDDNRSLPEFPFKTVGTFCNGSNYFQRVRMIRRVIKEILSHNYNPQNTVFYIFNLDIMISFRSVVASRKYRYIYEVSDLTELVINNKLVRDIVVRQNRLSMTKALQVVFTSEGFCDYYNTIPRNKIVIIPNKINEKCPAFDISTRQLSLEKIRIGFVGIIRFPTLYNFAKVCKDFANVEFHLYGLLSKADDSAIKVEELAAEHKNIVLHGPFKNPQDLPSIYSDVDMVFAAYPPSPGVVYAEPNKLYEAIYFRCPIIVNKGTFSGKKVQMLNIGYVIDAMDESEIITFLKGLDNDMYQEKVRACLSIPQKECFNINNDFFDKLESLW